MNSGLNIWIMCGFPMENGELSKAKWRLAVLHNVSVYFPECDASYPWQDFEKCPIVEVPDFEDWHRIVEALEFYANPNNYHANGSPGQVVLDKDTNIEMWAADRGHTACKALDWMRRRGYGNT